MYVCVRVCDITCVALLRTPTLSLADPATTNLLNQADEHELRPVRLGKHLRQRRRAVFVSVRSQAHENTPVFPDLEQSLPLAVPVFRFRQEVDRMLGKERRRSRGEGDGGRSMERG